MSFSVLNYGGGNLRSVTNLLDSLNTDYKVIHTADEVKQAEKIILPGQGHFGQIMDNLNEKGISQPIKDFINADKPFLGICIGLQILFESSDEAPNKEGLAIFSGKCVKFTEGKVPQMGWNKLNVIKENSLLTNDYVYFVNSYYVTTDKTEIIDAKAFYHTDFVSAVSRGNLLAMQFHPEKSGKVGIGIVKRWLENVN